MSIHDNTFLAAADQLGARLCRDSMWSADMCNWFGPSMEMVDGTWQVIHKNYGADLYAGTSGIALFLAHLYAATGEKRFKLTSQAAMQHAFNHRATLSDDSEAGVYSGLVGLAVASDALAQTLDEPRWLDAFDTLCKELVTTGVNQNGLDVVMGSAGSIAPLLMLSDQHNRTELLGLAVQHGELLLSRALTTDQGLCWPMLPGLQPLTGFAHGVSGAVWALMELADMTGEARFAEAAEQGVRWEQSHFNEIEQNWPDLRSASEDHASHACGLAWCHGSPGIGLSRIRAWQLTGNVEYQHQAMAALNSSSAFLHKLAPEQPIDFTLCHGVTGLTELLLYASRTMELPQHRQLIDHVVTTAINHHTVNVADWPCGVPEGAGEAPGLMLGIAGIGYSMLRMRDENPPPSVLLMGSQRKARTQLTAKHRATG